MTKNPDDLDPKLISPRYRGAKPGDMAKALFKRPKQKDRDSEEVEKAAEDSLNSEN